MKTIWEVGLIVVGVGVLAADAQAGRWLSRDPIQEGAGFVQRDPVPPVEFGPAIEPRNEPNLYVFVRNDGINSLDSFGLATIDTSARRIKLANCDIGILYGHGSGRRNYTWTMSRAPECSAGTAITCWPSENASGVGDNQDLWTTWGGEPVSDFVLVQWGLPASGPDFTNMGHRPNAYKALVSVIIAARQRAREICKRCCCKNVEIYFFEINKKGELVDPPAYKDGVPGFANIVIPCP